VTATIVNRSNHRTLLQQRQQTSQYVQWLQRAGVTGACSPVSHSIVINDRRARRSFGAHSASQTNAHGMGGGKVKRAIRHRVNLLIRVRPTSGRLFTHSASARGGIQACPRAQQRNRAVVTQAARRRTRRPSQKAGAARAQKLTWWLRQTPARCDRPCSRGAPHTSQCVHDASSADTGCFAWSLLGLLSSMCRAESERRPISCDARPCTGQRRDQPPCLSPQEEYNTKIMYNHHRSHRRAPHLYSKA
jgi:hypothetical protein